jgi:hypothetical protein
VLTRSVKGWAVYVWANRLEGLTLSHSYVVFSDNSKGWEQVCHDEKISNFFAEVAQLQRASFCAGRDVDANEYTQTHTVHVGQVCEVEDEALVCGEELGDRIVEEFGETC